MNESVSLTKAIPGMPSRMSAFTKEPSLSRALAAMVSKSLNAQAISMTCDMWIDWKFNLITEVILGKMASEDGWAMRQSG